MQTIALIITVFILNILHPNNRINSSEMANLILYSLIIIVNFLTTLSIGFFIIKEIKKIIKDRYGKWKSKK